MKKGYRDAFQVIHKILMICELDEVTKSIISRHANIGGVVANNIIENLEELEYLAKSDSGTKHGHGYVCFYKTTPKGLVFRQSISDWVDNQEKKVTHRYK